jgi:hypothetical protein
MIFGVVSKNWLTMKSEGTGKPKPSGVSSRPREKGEARRPSLARTMQQTAARLRRDFAPRIAQDPQKFKRLAVSHLRRYLPPGPGRPAGDAVTLALEFRKQGLEWKQIYPQCIPGHAQLTSAVRRQAESNLRGACRSRRNTARRRKARHDFSAATTPPANVPSIAPPDSGLQLKT